MPLNPEEAVFEAMLAGWARQQRTRFLREEATIGPRAALVRRLAEFTASTRGSGSRLRRRRSSAICGRGAGPVAVSTARGYEGALRMFCDYVTDARYGWPAVCGERFGAAPAQIFHEWNRLRTSASTRAQPGRRPLTYDEVQALFDAADGRAEEIRARGRRARWPRCGTRRC